MLLRLRELLQLPHHLLLLHMGIVVLLLRSLPSGGRTAVRVGIAPPWCVCLLLQYLLQSCSRGGQPVPVLQTMKLTQGKPQ